MHGRYTVTIKNKYVKYEFTVERKYTIVRGNSGSGKSYLSEILRNPYTQVFCDAPIYTLTSLNSRVLQAYEDSILIIDEDRNLDTEEIASAMKHSSNYYVLCTHKDLKMIPYSISEIYTITSRYGPKRDFTTNVFVSRYFNDYIKNSSDVFKAGKILICEDSKSGREFYSLIWRPKLLLPEKTKGGEGNSNIISEIKKVMSDDTETVVVMIDGAAYGPYIRDLEQVITYSKARVIVYAPESFEYLLLRAINSNVDKLNRTYDFCDSKIYNSWEDFYTRVLTDYGLAIGFPYSKSGITKYYIKYLKRVEDVIMTMI